MSESQHCNATKAELMGAKHGRITLGVLTACPLCKIDGVEVFVGDHGVNDEAVLGAAQCSIEQRCGATKRELLEAKRGKDALNVLSACPLCQTKGVKVFVGQHRIDDSSAASMETDGDKERSGSDKSRKRKRGAESSGDESAASHHSSSNSNSSHSNSNSSASNKDGLSLSSLLDAPLSMPAPAPKSEGGGTRKQPQRSVKRAKGEQAKKDEDEDVEMMTAPTLRETLAMIPRMFAAQEDMVAKQKAMSEQFSEMKAKQEAKKSRSGSMVDRNAKQQKALFEAGVRESDSFSDTSISDTLFGPRKSTDKDAVIKVASSEIDNVLNYINYLDAYIKRKNSALVTQASLRVRSGGHNLAGWDARESDVCIGMGTSNLSASDKVTFAAMTNSEHLKLVVGCAQLKKADADDTKKADAKIKLQCNMLLASALLGDVTQVGFVAWGGEVQFYAFKPSKGKGGKALFEFGPVGRRVTFCAGPAGKDARLAMRNAVQFWIKTASAVMSE